MALAWKRCRHSARLAPRRSEAFDVPHTALTQPRSATATASAAPGINEVNGELRNRLQLTDGEPPFPPSSSHGDWWRQADKIKAGASRPRLWLTANNSGPSHWVMSPIRCCSTPRIAATTGHPTSAFGTGGRPRRPRLPWGLPTVLSGAALGHDRVRDGTGWGQRALGHGRPSPPGSTGGRDAPTCLRKSAPLPRRGTAPPGRPRALHATS